MTVLDRIIQINTENKIRFKEDLLKYKTESAKKDYIQKFTWSLMKKERGLWILYNRETKLVLTNIGQIVRLLQQHPKWHISNISVVKNQTKIVSKYIFTEQEWYNIICLIQSEYGLNCISIIKVDNMNSFISKGLLIGKYKVLVDNIGYMVILKDKDIIILSELDLYVTPDTKFTLSKLLFKHIKITNLNVSNLDSLANLFYNCFELETVYFENFDTSNVKSFYAMFEGCVNLRNVNVEVLDTSNLNTITDMFRRCESLEHVDLSKFSIKNLKYCSGVFASCKSIQKTGVEKWDFEYLTRKQETQVDLSEMFSYCKVLMGFKKEILIQILYGYCFTSNMFKGTRYESRIEDLRKKIYNGRNRKDL